jgi:hypothetical protein
LLPPGAPGRSLEALGNVSADDRNTIGSMKAMFYAYLVVIVSGITYFSVIGLTHH